MPWFKRLLTAALTVTALLGMSAPAHAQLRVLPSITVAVEPYVDIHTGPGRGFPIQTIAARGEPLVFLKRRAGWFKVRNVRGQEGWMPESAVVAVLDDPAISQTVRDAILGVDDLLRMEVGFAAGQLDGDPVVAVRGGYWLTDQLLAELAVSQVSGTYSSSRLYSAGLQASPWGLARYAPYFGVAYGRFENNDRASLVGGGTEETVDTVSADAGIVSLGLRVRFNKRMVLRADVRQVLVLTDNERFDDFTEYVGGFSFAF